MDASGSERTNSLEIATAVEAAERLFLLFRWRSEDRRFQHRVLQEHGGSHGCILSITLLTVTCRSITGNRGLQTKSLQNSPASLSP